jgi:hypothetical protein
MWLSGPVGNTRGIGKDFFHEYAKRHELEIVESGPRGLLLDFDSLAGVSNDPRLIATAFGIFMSGRQHMNLMRGQNGTGCSSHLELHWLSSSADGSNS